MVKKITISVPDELHEKIQDNKDKFKVSKVCQEALEREVKLAALCDKHDITALKARLEKEKTSFFRGHWEEGVNDGVSDAFGFDYSTFTRCIDYFKHDTGDNEDKFGAFEYFSNRKHNNKYGAIVSGELFIPINNGADKDDRFFLDAAYMYFLGWCVGVQTVFDQMR